MTRNPLAEIEISFANKQKLSEREQAALEVMRGLLERRYFDVLREKEHLTYTVGVQSNYTSQPVAGESLNIHLSTAKENADKAVSLVYSILDAAPDCSSSTAKGTIAALNSSAEKRPASYLQMIMPLPHQYSRHLHHKISLL